MAKKSFYFIVLVILLIYSFNAIQLHQINLQQHEISRAETHEMYEANLPILDYFNILKYDSVIADRGPLYPLLIRLLKSSDESHLYQLRYISLFSFFILALLAFYYLKYQFPFFVILSSLALLFTNELLFYYITSISPYMFNLLLIFVVTLIYQKFDKSIVANALLATVAFAATASFYTNALPCCLVLFLLRKDIHKKYRIFYFPFLTTLIVKGIMIVLFRFYVRLGQSGFYENSPHIFLNSLLELFSLGWSNMLESHFTISAVYFIFAALIFYSTIKILKNKTNDKLNLFFKYYLYSTFLLFFIMSLTGAREIKITYFIGLLPLFYLLNTQYYLARFKSFKGITLAILFFSTSYFVHFYKVKNQVSNIYYEPIQSLAKYFENKNLSASLICFPEDLSQGEKLWNYFWGAKNDPIANKMIFKNANNCKKIIKNKKTVEFDTLYLVYFNSKMSRRCHAYDSVNCPQKGVQTLVKDKSLVEQFTIPSYQKNTSAYIMTYQ